MFALNLISVLLSNAFFLHHFMFLGDPFFLLCVHFHNLMCFSIYLHFLVCVQVLVLFTLYLPTTAYLILSVSLSLRMRANLEFVPQQKQKLNRLSTLEQVFFAQ